MSASTASSSSLLRYRPAILALAAIATGLTVYYVHQSFSTPSGRLHRRGAVHRRQRPRNAIQYLRGPGVGESRSGARYMEPDQLLVLLEQQHANERSIDLGSAPSIVVGEGLNTGAPILRFNTEDAPLRQYLTRASSMSGEERATYERAFLMAFLAHRMPVYTRLETSEGTQAFCERLVTPDQSGFAFFSSQSAVEEAATMFNRLSCPVPTDTLIPIDLERLPEALQQFEEANRSPCYGVMRPRSRDGTTEEVVQETTANVVELSGGVTDDESEASWKDDDENDETKRDGQSLLNMLYHIAEDQSRRDGYVHRGIGCNSCGTTPIRGVRYRCSNCADYDLCEQCESMQIHPKTHLFYKIRVPAPFFDSPRFPQPTRYPGKPAHLPNHLSRETVKNLGKQSGRETAEIEALWDQFKCLAATEWPSDPGGFRMAIDKDVFDQYFLPGPLKRRKPPNLPIHDRIFAFFDTNGDGLIGFEEFIMGIATIRTNDKTQKYRRIFDCYDMDSDGYIRRKDFLRLFWSYYTLTKDFTDDAFLTTEEEIMEGETLRETLQGSQPISATFTGSVESQSHVAHLVSKRFNGSGDPVINDDGPIFAEDDGNLPSRDEIVGDIAETSEFGSVFNYEIFGPIIQGRENEHPLSRIKWPPTFLQKSDVEAVMGSGVSADSVVTVHDRLEVLRHVDMRRKERRQEALQRRQTRRQFYEHNHDTTSRSREADPTGSDSSDESSHEVHFGRMPPTLEADAGQEYLYQILEESMNELLDPLFRFREDLHVEAILCKKKIEDLPPPELSSFNCKSYRDLCRADVDRFLQELYDRGAMEYDIPQELWEWIVRQHDCYSKSYIPYVDQLLHSGLVTKDEYIQKVRFAKYQQEDLRAAMESDSDESSSSVADDDAPRILDEDTTHTEADVSNTVQRITQEVDDRDAARVELANGIGAQLDQAELQLSDDATELEREIAAAPLEQLLEDSGFSVLEHSDRNPPNSPKTQNRAAISGSGSPPRRHKPNGAVPPKPSPQDDEDSPDPTLPHMRPHVDDDRNNIRHLSFSKENPDFGMQRLHWKYLIMLDCLFQEDISRGGAGSLSFDDFLGIMKGPMGMNLDFLGMFYEMVLF